MSLNPIVILLVIILTFLSPHVKSIRHDGSVRKSYSSPTCPLCDVLLSRDGHTTIYDDNLLIPSPVSHNDVFDGSTEKPLFHLTHEQAPTSNDKSARTENHKIVPHKASNSKIYKNNAYLVQINSTSEVLANPPNITRKLHGVKTHEMVEKLASLSTLLERIVQKAKDLNKKHTGGFQVVQPKATPIVGTEDNEWAASSSEFDDYPISLSDDFLLSKPEIGENAKAKVTGRDRIDKLNILRDRFTFDRIHRISTAKRVSHPEKSKYKFEKLIRNETTPEEP